MTKYFLGGRCILISINWHPVTAGQSIYECWKCPFSDNSACEFAQTIPRRVCLQFTCCDPPTWPHPMLQLPQAASPHSPTWVRMVRGEDLIPPFVFIIWSPFSRTSDFIGRVYCLHRLSLHFTRFLGSLCHEKAEFTVEASLTGAALLTCVRPWKRDGAVSLLLYHREIVPKYKDNVTSRLVQDIVGQILAWQMKSCAVICTTEPTKLN